MFLAVWERPGGGGNRAAGRGGEKSALPRNSAKGGAPAGCAAQISAKTPKKTIK